LHGTGGWKRLVRLVATGDCGTTIAANLSEFSMPWKAPETAFSGRRAAPEPNRISAI
jgi:hypothetical protein